MLGLCEGSEQNLSDGGFCFEIIGSAFVLHS